jgi:hypothetical protein
MNITKEVKKLYEEYRPYLSVLLLIVVVGVILFLASNAADEITEIPTPSPALVEKISYPDDWLEIEDEDVVFKAQKDIEAEVLPTVVLVTSTAEIENPATYLDSLVQGAKRAISSLVIETESSQEIDNFYMRELSGYYFSGSDKVGIKQRVFVKGDNVHTLTASFLYADDTEPLAQEIEEIFSQVYELKIKSS